MFVSSRSASLDAGVHVSVAFGEACFMNGVVVREQRHDDDNQRGWQADDKQPELDAVGIRLRDSTYSREFAIANARHL